MQMKHAVLCVVVLLITTASFGVSEKSHSDSKSGVDTTSKRHDSNNRAKRMSHFPQVGQGDDIYPGENLLESLDDEMDSSIVAPGAAPHYLVPADKSQSDTSYRTGRSPPSFVRIGKAQYHHNDKRQSNFVRIGKSSAQVDNPLHRFSRSSHFWPIGRDTNSEVDTADYPGFKDSGLLGMDSEGRDRELLKRMSSFVRIGKLYDTDSDLMKRASSFVRIGKSAEEDKRASNFVRIGKSETSDEDDKDKRASSFVRIGKAGLDTDIVGESSKRGSSFVRIGKSSSPDGSFSLPYSLDDSSDRLLDDAPTDVAKRGSSFVRIGKSPPSSFVRIGRGPPSAFVRIGRGPPMAFVRIGRGPSSAFVRIGKKRDFTIDPAEYSRWVGE